MWVLLWVQLTTNTASGNEFEHYLVGSYTKQKVCELEKEKSKVLVRKGEENEVGREMEVGR